MLRFLPLAVLLMLAACDHAADSTLEPGLAPAATAVAPALVGTAAPAFDATWPDGSGFHFDPATLERPVILVFYRGGWCPFCNAQLMELRSVHKPLETELGYDVYFLSADSAETLATGDVPEYRLLSDNDLDAARQFGIAFKVDEATVQRYREYGIDLEQASGRQHHGLPVPAVFIVNAAGDIAFHYVNVDYRQRISPDLVMAAARAALDARDVRARNTPNE